MKKQRMDEQVVLPLLNRSHASDGTEVREYSIFAENGQEGFLATLGLSLLDG